MNLSVTYDTLKGVGQTVMTKGEEFNSLLNKIKSYNAELQGVWQGGDATKYTGAVAEQAEVMAQLAKTIDESGQFLMAAAEKYRATTQANMDAIR